MNSAQPSQSAPPERQVWFEPLTLADLDVVWDTEKQAYTHPWTQGNFRDSLQSGYPAQMLVTPVLPGDAPTLRTASGLIGIGSPRASLESNFALRELVGEANFYAAVEQAEWACQLKMLQILQQGGVPTPRPIRWCRCRQWRRMRGRPRPSRFRSCLSWRGCKRLLRSE